MQISVVRLLLLMTVRILQHGNMMRQLVDTLTGLGAYLGLPKAVNAGELPNVDVPESVTYNVTMEDEMMTVVIEAGTGSFGLTS